MTAERAFDWMFRTAMLVLAGLVTLAMLGSLAAISNDVGGPPFGAERIRPATQSAPEVEPAAPALPEAEPREDVAPVPGAESGVREISVAAPEEDDSERWLEAIAYALVALAGLAAIALLLLWRGVRELGRIADSLVSRPPPS